MVPWNRSENSTSRQLSLQKKMLNRWSGDQSGERASRRVVSSSRPLICGGIGRSDHMS